MNTTTQRKTLRSVALAIGLSALMQALPLQAWAQTSAPRPSPTMPASTSPGLGTLAQWLKNLF